MARSRRAFLAAVGASATLAGCTARAPRGEPQYLLSVRTLQGADHPFEFEVETKRAFANRWKPMTLRATYTNTQDAEETEAVTYARSPTVFSDDPDPPEIALLDPETDYTQREPGCWTPDTDGIGVLLAEFDFSDLPAGTTLHLDYAVWGTPRADGGECLQPGTYRVPMRFGLGVEIEIVVESG
jgi:hypothetical protein